MSNSTIRPTSTPNFSAPPAAYDAPQQAQFQNQLRLYGKQIDTSTGELIRQVATLQVLGWLEP